MSDIIHPAGSRFSDHFHIIADRVIKAESSCEIVSVKPVASQNPTCDITSQATLADDIDRLRLFELIDMLTQFIDGNVDKSLHMTPGVFRRRAHIEKRRAPVSGKLLHILIVPLFYHTVFDILDNVARHIYRILRGRIGRRVGEIKIDQWENTGKVGLTEYGVADYAFNYSAPLDEWVQLTIVSDNRGTSLYVNGEFMETIQARINGPAARIGANTGDDLRSRGLYRGFLDELKIFERSLTDEEIAALYTEPDQPEPSEPVSKKTLEYFLNSAKAHVENGDTEDCIQEVKDLFTEAIAEGEAVMADENATRDEVMNASFKLMKAIHALNFKRRGQDRP